MSERPDYEAMSDRNLRFRVAGHTCVPHHYDTCMDAAWRLVEEMRNACFEIGWDAHGWTVLFDDCVSPTMSHVSDSSPHRAIMIAYLEWKRMNQEAKHE